MSIHDPHGSPPRDNGSNSENDTIELDLVAYLDGELEPSEVADIEQRLATDPSFRQQLHNLQQSWDMLDLLSTSDVSEEFTGTTLEMAVVDVQQKTKAAQQRVSRWQTTTWILAAACCGLSILAGFGFVSAALQRPDHTLLRDLPMVENIDYYVYGDSPEFIQRLHNSGLFENDEEPTTKLLLIPFATNDESLAERRSRLEQLSPDDKERVRHKQERFKSMNSAEQRRTRKFHAAMTSGDDAAALQWTIVEYHDWLKGLSTADRYSVLELQDAERISRIESIQQEQASSHVDAVVQKHISPDDFARVFQWLQKLVATRKDSIVSTMPRIARQRYDATDSEAEQRRMLMMAIRQRPNLVEPTEVELEQLTSRLSSPGQQFIKQSLESQELSGLFKNLVRLTSNVQSQFRNGRRMNVSNFELHRYFRSLAPAEQRRLRMLPPDEMWKTVKLRFWLNRRRPEGDRKNPDRPQSA